VAGLPGVCTTAPPLAEATAVALALGAAALGGALGGGTTVGDADAPHAANVTLRNNAHSSVRERDADTEVAPS
jgi:hypothetical protein